MVQTCAADSECRSGSATSTPAIAAKTALEPAAPDRATNVTEGLGPAEALFVLLILGLSTRRLSSTRQSLCKFLTLVVADSGLRARVAVVREPLEGVVGRRGDDLDLVI